MAVLVDASTILALASIGELELLHTLFGKVTITKEVKDEVLVKEESYKHVVKKALGKWISIIRSKRTKKKVMMRGLGAGERSLFSVFKEGDLLVIDDALARRTARALGYDYTGLLGILISSAQNKIISKKKAINILEGLASSRFHMSASLFIEVRKRIEQY